MLKAKMKTRRKVLKVKKNPLKTKLKLKILWRISQKFKRKARTLLQIATNLSKSLAL